jgi:hypothetical protein
MNAHFPRLALLALLAVVGMTFSSSAEAARRPFTGVPLIIITTPKPLSPH